MSAFFRRRKQGGQEAPPARSKGALAPLRKLLSPQVRTAMHWDRLTSTDFFRDFNRRNWGGIAQIHQNHNYVTTGRRDHYWVDYLKDKYFPDGEVGDLLAMGCGEGRIERIFQEHGLRFSSVTGFDISPSCIEAAQRLAEECELAPRVTYRQVDLNDHELEPDSCDFISFFHSLHHIEALERVLASCHAALRSGGLMMVNEFVGPSRFQWTDLQLEKADELLALLPEPLRHDLENGGLKERNRRPTIEEMIETDPSESVRSAEIETVLQEHFEIVEESHWGGTINNLLFASIAGNFDPDNPYHNAIIELLIHHENTLIREGLLPSDFKLLMVRPR